MNILAFPDATSVSSTAALRSDVARGLQGVMEDGWVKGVSLDGQLLRPVLGYAARVASGRPQPGSRFWRALLAVQFAHEASLLHDDILDNAATRRGRPTVFQSNGAAAALVRGDHFLTAAYRHAAASGSLAFCEMFAEAVERTVAGEIEQGRTAGQSIGMERYRSIVLGKSGALIGAALSALGVDDPSAPAADLYALGQRIGLVYQMVDDLLDYCPTAETGKAPFADHRQRKWTWVLAEVENPFSLSADDLLTRLTSGGDASPLHRALDRLREEISAVERAAFPLLVDPAPLLSIVHEWEHRAHAASNAELAAAAVRPAGIILSTPTELPQPGAAGEIISRHSRSFRLASRFFPRRHRERIERLYAFCRITDDIGDEGDLPPAERLGRLDEWERIALSAYAGSPSGVPLVDRTMADARGAGVPPEYVRELIAGVRMDLEGAAYRSQRDLDAYCFRVASVVGLWVTRMAGIHRPEVLQAAADLGSAMQLTNIARDVGEDLGRGRVYLPADLLARHGLEADDLRSIMAGSEQVPPRYAELIAELLNLAEKRYRSAIPAIRDLPLPYRLPVAVAAYVYRGIHGSIRRNGMDTLRRRAYTSPVRKAALVAVALSEVVRGVFPVHGERSVAAAATAHSPS